MTTIFIPSGEYANYEVFAMLPAHVQAEWTPTEGAHYTAVDTFNELCQLALDALRACRINALKARLCVHDGHVCMRINGSYKQQQCIAQLEQYMCTDDVWQFLSHSGMPCLVNIH